MTIRGREKPSWWCERTRGPSTRAFALAQQVLFLERKVPRLGRGMMRRVLARDDNSGDIDVDDAPVLAWDDSCYFKKRKVPRLGRGMTRRVLARDDNSGDIDVDDAPRPRSGWQFSKVLARDDNSAKNTRMMQPSAQSAPIGGSTPASQCAAIKDRHRRQHNM